MAILLESSILGEIIGFKEGNLYTLADGTQWLQIQRLSEGGIFRTDPPVKVHRAPDTGRVHLEVIGV